MGALKMHLSWQKPVNRSGAAQQVGGLILAVLCGAFAGLASARADANCVTITLPSAEIAIADCTQVWPVLQKSGVFPDVFASSGKMTELCYTSTGVAPGKIGSTPVTMSFLTGWTTDFLPFLLGGTDNLGTVVTQVTISQVHGRALGRLFTRDILDLSQILSTGAATEEDVIVDGAAVFEGARGTYRVTATPEDPEAAKVKLTNLSGSVCFRD